MTIDKKHEAQLFSIKLYLKIFFVLLALIVLNIVISQLDIPIALANISLIIVASVQAVLVSLFFMELLHENKFYTFIWASTVLFMLIFFVITLFELNGRGQFDQIEGIKYMRQIEKQ